MNREISVNYHLNILIWYDILNLNIAALHNTNFFQHPVLHQFNTEKLNIHIFLKPIL